MQTEEPLEPIPDRRKVDRRRAQTPTLPFPDRRQDDRRSGLDRRGMPKG